MKPMVRFLLNGKLMELNTESVPSLTLDWLRHEAGLTGTKEGCREGDCGACMVLLGQRPFQVDEGSPSALGTGDPVEWLPVTSCLLAVSELDGKHLITIEGLAEEGPTAVMKALHDENASQCGFCSPGVVIALTGRLLQGGPLDGATLKRALEGNLCRCTGYGSLHRSAERLAQELQEIPGTYSERMSYLVAKGVLGAALARTLYSLPEPAGGSSAKRGKNHPHILPLGGGTDWFVKHSEAEPAEDIDFIDTHAKSRRISRSAEGLLIGASVSMRDFFIHKSIRDAYPGIEAFEDLVASPGIRSRATLAGNIANASPVADMTAMLLAMDARLILADQASGNRRQIALEDYFIGYKKTAAADQEEIEAILLPWWEEAAHGADRPLTGSQEDREKRRYRFNFEKAAKRDRLDIAAVNTAICILLKGNTASPIETVGPEGAHDSSHTAFPVLGKVRISAGGVGPTPLLLRSASRMLEGQALTTELVMAAADTALKEISPISDVRGSAEYRREALRRLFLAHFINLFPHHIDEEVLVP